MKAIIETGGKQYTVTEGTEIYVEKVTGEAGDTVTFDKVLMLDGKVGMPYVENAKVVGEIELNKGNKMKVVIFKYNAKKITIKLKVIDNHILKLLLNQLNS